MQKKDVQKKGNIAEQEHLTAKVRNLIVEVMDKGALDVSDAAWLTSALAMRAKPQKARCGCKGDCGCQGVCNCSPSYD